MSEILCTIPRARSVAAAVMDWARVAMQLDVSSTTVQLSKEGREVGVDNRRHLNTDGHFVFTICWLQATYYEYWGCKAVCPAGLTLLTNPISSMMVSWLAITSRELNWMLTIFS